MHSGITSRQYCAFLNVLAATSIDGLNTAELNPSERIAARILFRIWWNRFYNWLYPRFKSVQQTYNKRHTLSDAGFH